MKSGRCRAFSFWTGSAKRFKPDLTIAITALALQTVVSTTVAMAVY